MAASVLVSTFHPFPNVVLSLPPTTHLDEVPTLVAARLPGFPDAEDLYVSLHSGANPNSQTTLSEIHPYHVSLRITPRVRGGKGGFGSQLRAAGGRMSSQKTSNNDSCRDLSGRRLSTVKEAKMLAEYLEAEPERKKAASEARKAKIESLERQLGIESSSGNEPRGGKRRFEDSEYLEQSRDIVDGVKSAVVAGILKKKKAKTKHQSNDSKSNGSPADAVVEKTVELPAATIAVSAVATPVGATA